MKQVKLSDIRNDPKPDKGPITTSSAPLGEFGVGDVIATGFNSLFSNFFSYTLITAIVFAPLVLWALFAENGLSFIQYDVETIGWPGFGAVMFVTAVLGYIAYSAIVYGAIEQQARNQINFVAIFAGGVNVLLPVFLVSILATLLTAVGYVLLIIPGIIISLALTAAVPVVIAEKLGPIDALKRSIELTNGFKGNIFLVHIVLGIINAIFGFLIELIPFSALTSGSEGPSFVALGIFLFQMSVTTALGGTIAAAIYTQLRVAKEGTSADEIAQVFA
jgi:membrane-anchored glycerophosphoryl diester phosphodiesterase (GDPDase)